MKGSGRQVLAISIVLLTVLALAACGRSANEAGGTPGFSSKDRTVDTKSPFEMANPTTTAGPTTIPGAGPTLPLPTTTDPVTGESAVVGELPASRTPKSSSSRNTSDSSPYAPPVVVTTTTTPTQPIPAPPDGTFCGFSAYLQSMISVLTNPALDSRSVMTAAMPIVRRMQALAPVGARPDVDIVVQRVQALVDLLASQGWNVNSPDFRAATNPLIAGAPEVQPFIAAFDRVSFAEAAVCRK